MGRKLYLPLFLISILGLNAFAQTGEIKGRVLEKGTKEGVPFASVAALLGGSQVQATVTDIDGNYSIKPLNPGKYDVKATSVGYSPFEKTGVIVSTDKISFVDLELGKGAVDLKTVEVSEYSVPLIDKGSPQTQKTVTYEDIQAAPVRDVNSIASQSAGVYQRDEGGELNIRGSRSDATAYYVDGIKVRGGVGISNKGTEQITVITGGLPAQYGDVTGGVISVTTRGPSKDFAGGIDALSSKLFDDYNNNIISFDLSGPIFTPRDSTGRKSGQPLAGFFFAGDYYYDGDPDPRSGGVWKAKDDKLAEISLNPLVQSTTGNGFNQRAAFFTYDSLEHVNARQNVASQGYRINGKLDFRPVKNVTLTVGGSYDFKDSRNATATRDFYGLFNAANNAQQLDNNWRVFGKITQRFGNSENQSKSSSAIKNAFYSIQVDYSKNKTTGQNDQHKDNFFDYGYVGQFVTHKAGLYFSGTPKTVDGITVNSPIELGNYVDYLVDFHPSDLNPVTTNYTTQYYNLAPDANGYYNTLTDITDNHALVNGDNRINLYVNGLWASPGRVPAGYSITNQSQLRVTASGSADIKDHNIVIGMEYEQRVDRGWNINASSLWNLMRGLEGVATNFQHTLDTSTKYLEFPGIDINGDGIIDTIISYHPLNVPTTNVHNPSQVAPGFHENIHQQLGIPNYAYLDIDSYTPSTYNLNLFTADELAPVLGAYYGYDYTGKISDAKPSLDDFFFHQDGNKNYTRQVAPFEPNYTAGYISDRFSVNDLIFNVGVRVDRFDANQKTLVDPYSLWTAFNAGDVRSGATHLPGNTPIPSNIEDDYVVYANDFNNPTSIVGYRKGDKWFDGQGAETTDLSLITNNSTGPYLKHPEHSSGIQKQIEIEAFKDYEPQVNVMPRIAFSFPISDEAYFAAHYDILVQRPDESLLRMTPSSYLGWYDGISGTFNNPDLKPERTTDYEIAFQQKLSKSSAFSISAFYKELRDMIHQVSAFAAFPISYTTYGNIDFGTVKGLSFTYDLRKTGNVKMNLSYTLQFADGTGSKATSNAGLLANAGQNNLREIKPLDFDQRHTFVVSLDYHYGSGKNYDGPVWFNKQFFAKTGLSLVFRAGSGTPYTRQSNIAPTADLTVTSRNVIAGSINGSRLPWSTNVDLKVDKDFDIKMGKKKDGESRKPLSLNVYLQVLNVLDAQNITSVYNTTGNAGDDGYLTSSAGIVRAATAPSPQAYFDQYQIAANNPNHYSLPRRIRLGLQLNF